jgi:hypothetical protein
MKKLLLTLLFLPLSSFADLGQSRDQEYKGAIRALDTQETAIWLDPGWMIIDVFNPAGQTIASCYYKRSSNGPLSNEDIQVLAQRNLAAYYLDATVWQSPQMAEDGTQSCSTKDGLYTQMMGHNLAFIPTESVDMLGYATIDGVMWLATHRDYFKNIADKSK